LKEKKSYVGFAADLAEKVFMNVAREAFWALSSPDDMRTSGRPSAKRTLFTVLLSIKVWGVTG